MSCTCERTCHDPSRHVSTALHVRIPKRHPIWPSKQMKPSPRVRTTGLGRGGTALSRLGHHRCSRVIGASGCSCGWGLIGKSAGQVIIHVLVLTLLVLVSWALVGWDWCPNAWPLPSPRVPTPNCAKQADRGSDPLPYDRPLLVNTNLKSGELG